jgi:hypothetical protein
MKSLRLPLYVLSMLPLSLLLGACEQDTQQADRCLHHYQGTFGNYTKWGPCPAKRPPRPWENPGR